MAIVGNHNQCELGKVAIIRYSPFEAGILPFLP